jgi:hypothetical protein
MVDDAVEPGRSPRPRCEHLRVETFGEDPSPAKDAVAVEPARDDHQANRPATQGQARQLPAITPVHPVGLSSASGTHARLASGTDGDPGAGIVTAHVAHDKAARDKRRRGKCSLHGLDPRCGPTPISVLIPPKLRQTQDCTPIHNLVGRTDLRAMSTVAWPEAKPRTLGSWVVQSGRAGAKPA